MLAGAMGQGVSASIHSSQCAGAKLSHHAVGRTLTKARRGPTPQEGSGERKPVVKPAALWAASHTKPSLLIAYRLIFLGFFDFIHSGKVDQSPAGSHGSCPTKKSGTMAL